MWKVLRNGALIVSLSMGTQSFAQEASRDAVTAVIQSQLDALMRDDFATAFTFASPMIQNMFRTPGNFGAMVRQGYPMVWRPADVRFGAVEMRGPQAFQKVFITDGQGNLHALEYEMIPIDGDWQINGVRLLRAPDVGA